MLKAPFFGNFWSTQMCACSSASSASTTSTASTASTQSYSHSPFFSRRFTNRSDEENLGSPQQIQVHAWGATAQVEQYHCGECSCVRKVSWWSDEALKQCLAERNRRFQLSW